MKATIKDTFCIALFGISLLALPFAAHAGQDEHQRYLIRQAIKAKQELKQEAKQQQAKMQDKKCHESSQASSTEGSRSLN